MIAVSDNFKSAMKKPVKELDGYIQIDDNKITSSDDLISFKVSCETSMCKSAMRKLEASYLGDHNLLDKWVKVAFGVKLSDGTYEYLDYGSFLINEITTSIDTGVTTITGYDKMINAMVEYEPLDVQYPIGLYDYTKLLCSACGLELYNDSFTVHNDWEITQELWTNISGVTYRDIFVQIAEVTATTCIIKDDKIYFKPITKTSETLTYENMFKLKLEPIYGEINSVVLSRTPITGEDVFLKDDESINTNGLTEFQIDNNEIIDKDRENAITPIYEALHGISYYPFEVTTEGLGWYEIGDSFTINDNDENFKTVLFNFSISIDGGISETLKTSAETKTQTQYQYASSISKRIANTEITVDKQNQTIDAVVSEVSTYSDRITQTEQTVDSLSQKVSDIETIEREQADTNYVHIEDAVQGKALYFAIKSPISLLYPSDDLYPFDDLYPLDSYLIIDTSLTPTENLRKVRLPFSIVETGEVFEIDKDGNCTLTKTDGTVEELGTVDIELFDGDNYLYLESFQDDNVSLQCNYVVKNGYTDVYVTKVEMNSAITQTAEEINLEVSKKVGEDDVVSAINMSSDKIALKSNRISIESDNFTLTETGDISATSGTIGGFEIGADSLKATHKKTYCPYTEDDLTNIKNYIQGTITLTDEQFDFYDYNNDGKITSLDYVKVKNLIANTNYEYSVELNTKYLDKMINICDENGNILSNIGIFGGEFSKLQVNDEFKVGNSISYFEPIINDSNDIYVFSFDNTKDAGYLLLTSTDENGDPTGVEMILDALSSTITCTTLIQTSLAEKKKNFEKFTGALDLIKNTDVYKYNFKFEEDDHKKHIGLVIGDEYNTPDEVISSKGDAIDTYSLISVCLQSIKEQQEQIDKLQEEIDKLKEMIQNG